MKSRRTFIKEAQLELDAIPTLAAVEKAIGIKAVKWKRRCHEISCKMLDQKLVIGVERYGHYYGPVSRNYERHGLPFQPHGWIETPRGLVVDPTRWVFRMVAPYIFYGPSLDYDAGGQRQHFEQNGPYPAGPHDPAMDSPHLLPEQRELRAKLIQLIMPKAAMKRMAMQTGGQTRDFSFSQVFWLAHAPLPWWGEHAQAIYQAIADAGFKATIPFDNWRMAMNKPMASNLP
jgi:hypothetical protein